MTEISFTYHSTQTGRFRYLLRAKFLARTKYTRLTQQQQLPYFIRNTKIQ